MEWPEGGDVLDEVMFNKDASIVDFNRLIELANSSDKGSEQLADLVKCWEYRQANAVRLLREELDNLSKQHQEVELKKLEILDDHRVEKVEMDGEILIKTGLFGSKTFLIYAEPVFSKAGETIGVNYMGMDVTDQVRKREKMGKLREEMAVQTAKETELNKTIDLIL